MPATLVPMNEQKSDTPPKPRKTRSKSNFLIVPSDIETLGGATSLKEAKRLVAAMDDGDYTVVCVRAKLTVTTETTKAVKATK